MKTLKVSDQVRKIIKTCGQSRYALWKATGIDQATLSKFVNGKCMLSMESLDALAEVLGLEVTIRKGKDK